MNRPFTLIDGKDRIELPVEIHDGAVRLAPGDLKDGIGWELKPEGLCRGDVCVRIPDRSSLVVDGKVDLQGLANLLDRPVAIDADESAAAFGTPRADRAAQMHSLEAPDFTLPDLNGNLHSLSQHRGKKVLLIAHASW